MRERFNAVINDTILLRFANFVLSIPTDVAEVVGVDVYNVDPRIVPTATPIQTILPANVVHDSTGNYSYVMNAQILSGVYFDVFKYKDTIGGPELLAYQQIIVNEVIHVAPDICAYKKIPVGYTFGNYQVPAGEWGVAGTPDDLRYTFLFGNELVGTNGQEASDEQLAFVIEAATEEIESYLGIDIRKRIYKTSPATGLVRGRKVVAGVDYTDEEDPYPFRPTAWQNYGFLQLNHYPLVSVERAVLYSVVHQPIADLIQLGWLRIEKQAGQLFIYPKTNTFIYGPPMIASGAAWVWLKWVEQQYPEGFEIDYTAGYLNSDYLDRGLREVIMKLAAIGLLQWVGDGLLAGFSSSSISIDGLNEAFSSTQSATSAYFGARILSYQGEIKAWLQKNRYKYSNIPIAFA